MSETTTIRKTIFVAASPKTLWACLTDPDKVGQWFNPMQEEYKPNEDYACYKSLEDDEPLIWGKVLEMEVEKKLRMTFEVRPFGGKDTIVTYLLDEFDGGTRLTLIHEGVAEACGEAARETLMHLDRGWDMHLGQLRDLM